MKLVTKINITILFIISFVLLGFGIYLIILGEDYKNDKLTGEDTREQSQLSPKKKAVMLLIKFTNIDRDKFIYVGNEGDVYEFKIENFEGENVTKYFYVDIKKENMTTDTVSDSNQEEVEDTEKDENISNEDYEINEDEIIDVTIPSDVREQMEKDKKN